MLNLVSAFTYSADQHPDKTAVVCGNSRLTYKQMNGAINQIANGLLAAGIGKGDNVALSCLNLPYFPMAYYAILKVGATVVPLNVLSTGREIAYYLNDCNAKAYFCFQGTQELPMAKVGYEGFQQVENCKHFWVMMADPSASSAIEGTTSLAEMMTSQSVDCDIVCTSPDDTAVILYTSGTTGFPKGAELSHSNMVMNALASRSVMAFVFQDVQIVTLPLFHSFGQTCQMNGGFVTGNTLVLIPRFSPEAVFSALQQEKGTVFIGVPTMYWALLAYDNGAGNFDMEGIIKTLRLGVSGGSSLPLEILKGFEAKYRIPILEGYGLSETCPVATFNHLDRNRKPGSVGTPIWGVEVRIVTEDGTVLPAGEVGEVTIRGHNIMKGYYGKPEATAVTINDAGWFYSGDLGKLDDEGYLYIVDRVKDLIIRGGFNVYPREVEEVLMTHPAISLVAVLGVPYDQYGEEIKAYVVLKEGSSLVEEDLIAWCKEQMAVYKYPRIVEFRDTLPMTATGKILKKELKAELGQIDD
ncbi:MAG: long-chain fatty acid--CoA ligase [Desulfuromusa sp.]|nr:long-chain fatty acid--CoA ligase [Desulfuromusa sp.]